MMNTRNITGKTLKAVKDGFNAAKSHHTKLQENIYKQAEITSTALRCSSTGTAASKHSENKATSRTAFISNNQLPNQQMGWNTQFSLPLKISHNHTTSTLANCGSTASYAPVSSEFSTSAFGPRYELMTQQRRMMSTRAVNANRGTIEGIITTLKDKFNADIVNDTQAIYQFNILSGDRREIYYIDLRNGSGSAGKGKSEGSPDTIFSIDAENFNRLVEGNLRAPTAYMNGRMKISGSMQKAAKLEKLFATLLNN